MIHCNNHPCLECAILTWNLTYVSKILYDGDHVISCLNGRYIDQDGEFTGDVSKFQPITNFGIDHIIGSFTELSPLFQTSLRAYFKNNS